MAGVVFFGSPDFALPSLEILLKTEYRPALVVTQPDRRSGRGRALQPTPVRSLAEKKELPVLTLNSFADEGTIERIRSIKPDFLVVVAFGLIMPEWALKIPSKGSINVHASLLPAYRGASPINMALVNGEPFTGVSTMEMVKALDAGPVYKQEVEPVDPLENARGLSERLAKKGAELLLETVEAISKEGIVPVEQGNEGISYAPRLKKEDGLIPWDKGVLAVHNHIRGMNPWPGSYTFYGNEYIKIHEARPENFLDRGLPPGYVVSAAGDELVVSCGSGSIKLMELQAGGKRPLKVGEFLNGFSIAAGDILGGGK